MENKKINIAELLKDYPKDMELYSPLCGECRVIKIYNRLGFDVVNGNDDVFNFSYDGRYNLMGECCIFPSKDQRDWSKFQRPFNDGDIVATTNGLFIGIVKVKNNIQVGAYCSIDYTKDFRINNNYVFDRLATTWEREKLFHAIKNNGYKWNEETKTLEKLIEPKFKVGDIIQDITGICKVKITEVNVEDEYYPYKSLNINGIGSITFNRQDDWELVKDNPKFKVGDRVRNKNYKDYIYDIHDITDKGYRAKEINADSSIIILFGSQEDNYELVPNKFDVTTLKPFDKVLARQDVSGKWGIDFFGFYNEGYYHSTGNCMYVQCIPYENNEHLLGTKNDCDEYYKTW